MIEIEKNIPIPPLRRSKKDLQNAIATLANVGDSFLWDKSFNSSEGVYCFAAMQKKKVTVKKIGENQYRIWRIQ